MNQFEKNFDNGDVNYSAKDRTPVRGEPCGGRSGTVEVRGS